MQLRKAKGKAGRLHWVGFCFRATYLGRKFMKWNRIKKNDAFQNVSS